MRTPTLILAASLAATFVSNFAFAAERVARPLSASALKDVASTTQDVTLSGVMSNLVTVAPLTTSANGFGISKIAGQLDTAPFGTMPVIPLPVNASDAVVRERANQWVANSFNEFKDRYASWLRSKGLSVGFFNYTQEVNVLTAAGVKKKSIAFNAVIDSSGKPTYGLPKLVDSDPLTLDVRYVPLKPAEGLPPDWVFEGAGTVQWRVLNKKMEAVSGWTVIEANGAFDTAGDELLPEEKVACLMDLTSSPGCLGPTDVKTLMGQVGASTAFVSYSHSPEPVLEETSVEGEFAPVTGLSIDERVQQCGNYSNKGSFGYLLEAVADWYVADLTSSNLTYQLMNQTNVEFVSPTRSYAKEVSVEHLGMSSADGYIISPEEGQTELISRSDERIRNGTIDISYLAPLQMKASAPITFSGNAPVQDVSSPGAALQDFIVGWNWGHALSQGQHDRYTQFNIDNVADVSKATLASVTYDDYLMVKVNGHVVYVGAPSAGNTLEIGGTSYQGSSCYYSGRDWMCGTIGHRVYVRGAYLNRTCPAGSVGWDWGALSVKCYTMAEVTGVFRSCRWENRTWTKPAGYYCGNGCTDRQALYYTDNGGGYLCGPLERSQTWEAYPQIDLRPYLKNGPNTIEMRVVVGNMGHGAFRLSMSTCGQK